MIHKDIKIRIQGDLDGLRAETLRKYALKKIIDFERICKIDVGIKERFFKWQNYNCLMKNTKTSIICNCTKI